MLIILAPECTEVQRRRVLDAIRQAGCRFEETRAAGRSLVSVLGDLDRLRRVPLGVFAGVQRIVPLTPAHTLASLAHQREPTVVTVGDVRFGDGSFAVIGGPCAVEDGDSLLRSARAVKEAGAHMLRGGAWKPRTSPYSFRGLGLKGLRLLREVSQEVGLPTITEVMDPRHIEAVVSNADMIQIGTRNMSNFDLLVEVGRSGHPVLLKRGRSATVSDWLYAAEYVLAQGNARVVLCERGIRGFDPATRNILDIAAVPAVRQRSHLPIVIDPSHATGHSSYVPSMARAACAAGADGVMIEVHADPEHALSDADQAVRPDAFRDLCEDLRLLASVCRRRTEAGRDESPDPPA